MSLDSKGTVSYVYLMWAKGTNYFKIGHSRHPDKRLSSIRVSTPFDVRILALSETTDPVALESRLHQKYTEFKVRGEWFDVNREAWPQLIKDCGGEPAMVEMLAEYMHKGIDIIVNLDAELRQAKTVIAAYRKSLAECLELNRRLMSGSEKDFDRYMKFMISQCESESGKALLGYIRDQYLDGV